MTGSTSRPVRSLMLRSLTINPECWGRAAGEKIQLVLINRIAAAPPGDIWRLSLQGVTRLDVTFASAALVAVVQHFLGTRGICVSEPASEDVTGNLAAAAEWIGVPITVWQGSSAKVLGPAPSSSLREALTFAHARGQTFARDLADAHDLTITNASTRLRCLWDGGYLLREEVAAPSGGTEFVYVPIG